MADQININKNANKVVFSTMSEEEKRQHIRTTTKQTIEHKRKARRNLLRLKKIEADKSIGINEIRTRYMTPVNIAGDNLLYTDEIQQEKQRKNNQRLNAPCYHFMLKYNEFLEEERSLSKQTALALGIKEEEKKEEKDDEDEEYDEDREEIIEQEEDDGLDEDEIDRRKKAIGKLDVFFDKDDMEFNKKLVEDYLAQNDDYKKFFREKVDEVISYDFSPRMININWLAHNAKAFSRMIHRAFLMGKLYSYDLFEGDENRRRLLDTKIEQARDVCSAVMNLLKASGGVLFELWKGVEVIPNLEAEVDNMEYNHIETRKERLAERLRNEENLIKEGDEDVLERDEKRKKEFAPTAEVAALSLSDFIGAIGEKNRGQVILRNGRLTIINNGFFKRKRTGDDAAGNIDIKKQFVEKALELIEADKRDAYRPYLLGLVGLSGGETVTKPLSRKQIVAVMQEIKDQETSYKKILMSQGNERLKTYATKVENIFGEAPGEQDTSRVRKRKKEAIKSKIRQILRKKRQDMFNISEKRLDRLVDEHMGILKDQIYRNARAIELAVANMNGGQQAAIADDDELWEKLAADAILMLAARSENTNKIAAYRMDETIKDEIIVRSGKEELGSLIEKVHVPGFYNDATKDYFESVLAHREELFEGEADTQFQEDLEAFFLMMEKAGHISDFNRELLGRTTANMDLDKESMLEDAATVKLLITEKRANFDKIANAMGNSPFVAGYRALVQRMDEGFDYEEAEKQIVEGLSAHHEKMFIEEEVGVLAIRKMTAQEEAVYESLSAAEKAACDVLLLRKGMSDYIKAANDDTVRSTVSLLTALRGLEKNTFAVLPVNLGGAVFKLEQNKVGELFMAFGNKRLRLPTQSEGLINFIERDMCENVDKYGRDVIREHIIRQFDFHKDAYKNSDFTNMGRLAKDRDMAIRIILSMHKEVKYPYFEDTETEKLVSWANRLLDADDEVKRDIIIEVGHDYFMNDHDRLMHGKETYRLVSKLDTVAQEEMPVRLFYEEKITDEEEDGDKWTEEERKVKTFIADIVYGDVTLEDENKEEKTYTDTLLRNYDALQLILNSENYSFMDQVIGKMSIPDGEDGSQAAFLNDVIGKIRHHLKRVEERIGIKGLSKEELKTKLELPENRDKLKSIATYADNDIETGVETAAFTIQFEMTKAANEIFKERPQDNAQVELKSLTEKRITPEERKKRLDDHNKELNRRIALETKGNSGSGALTKEILSRYFRESSTTDKRYMMASLIRHSTPKKVLPNNASKEDKDKETIRRRGNMLGGLLKGAGPLMQKIMQGMPEQGLTPELKLAVKDMKSNLLPISENVVKARLMSMIQRSRGLVTKIDVTRSLGAASVGQAFLCKLYGPHLPAEGEEVVIKLLRPEVANRMYREKDIMEKAAKRVDKKMNPNLQDGEKGSTAKTSEGQLQSIIDELDLSVEAHKANLGAVYNNGSNKVKSVGVSKLILPSANTLMLEKAEGTTVDRYIRDVKEQRKQIMDRYYVHDGDKVRTDQATGKPVLQIAGKEAGVAQSLDELDEVLSRLEKRQKYLATVAEKWVQEGIYGEGFYHGDLHAGNIMINDDGATIIDFGNATKLSDEQKAALTKLTAAAAAGDEDYFLEAFEVLLPVESRATFNEKKREFKREGKAALELGNKESTGLRISLILLKAQTLGIEVPASINNFSQSQIRLQNTIEEVNNMIADLKEDMAALQPHEAQPKERNDHTEKPKHFFSVMTDVLMRNMAVSLKRLSFFKAYSYKKKLAQ